MCFVIRDLLQCYFSGGIFLAFLYILGISKHGLLGNLRKNPERQRTAKIFKTQIEKAIEELGVSYSVTFQGRFDTTPIRIEIEVIAREGEIP